MIKETKVLLLGATGLLGATLVPHLKSVGYNIVTHARKKGTADFIFNLDDSDTTCEFLARIQPSIIVNLVGLTDVDLCQQQTHAGYLANTHSVENLARWIKQSSFPCHLVQISTDQVYDGDGPHAEDSITLTNNYALTKYAGEIAAAQVPSTILRTNFVGRSKVSYRESLTDWVYTALTGSKNVQVLTDVLFSPLSMKTLVEMIDLVIYHKPVGVYNLGSNEGMSKADFDFEFAERIGLPTETMSRIDSSEATFLHTYRPKDMRMDCSKFEKALGITLPTLSDEIKRTAGEYYEKTRFNT
jgi:dTDP-4-dehydrorhamnose reductase